MISITSGARLAYRHDVGVSDAGNPADSPDGRQYEASDPVRAGPSKRDLGARVALPRATPILANSSTNEVPPRVSTSRVAATAVNRITVPRSGFVATPQHDKHTRGLGRRRQQVAVKGPGTRHGVAHERRPFEARSTSEPRANKRRLHAHLPTAPNTRRAIDFHEGDKVDEKALQALIRAAVALNTSAAAQRAGKRRGNSAQL